MAANSGIIDGGDVLVYAELSAGVWSPVLHCKDCSIENDTETRVRATKDTGQYDEEIPTKQSTTINVNALTTYDGTFGYFALRALQLAKTPVKLKYSGRPAADETAGTASKAEEIGDKYEEGMFIIKKCSRNDPKDEDSTMSASFKNSGAITIKTVAA